MPNICKSYTKIVTDTIVINKQTRSHIYNTGIITALLTNADEYYTLTSNLLVQDPALPANGLSSIDGVLTYTHTHDTTIMFLGTADLSVDTNSTKITFAITVNDVVVIGGETPTDFTNQDKLRNIAINKPVQLSNGDVLKVKAKSSNAGVTVTIGSINMTQWD